MSKSFRKHPICGITGVSSEINDKKLWHKAYRSKCNMLLASAVKGSAVEEDVFLPHFREVSDTWDFAKDGKTYFGTIFNLEVNLRRGKKRKVPALKRYGFRNSPTVIFEYEEVIKSYRK